MHSSRGIPSWSSVYQRINSFNNFNLKNIEIDVFKKIFAKITKGYVTLTLKVPVGAIFYRVRVNDGRTLFKSISELWYPHEKYVTKLGRANRIGQPMFYIADSGGAALRELRVEENQYISVLRLKSVAEMNVMEIGLYENIEKDSIKEAKQGYQTAMPNFYGSEAELKIAKMIRSFTINQFTKTISPAENYKYKPSIAIADYHLSAPRVIGLAYPSIASDLKDINFCIRPDAADSCLVPTHVDVVRIDKCNPTLRIQLVSGSDDFSATGDINYNGNFSPLEWATKSTN